MEERWSWASSTQHHCNIRLATAFCRREGHAGSLGAFVFHAATCLRAAAGCPWSIPTASPEYTFGVWIQPDTGTPPPLSHTPSVCMTSTTNCTSAAPRAARANDNPVGIQSRSSYRASFCSKWWQRFKSSKQTPAPLQGGHGSRSSQKLPQVSPFSMLTLVRGRKTSQTFFLFKHKPPHLSKEGSQFLFFPRGRIRSPLTGRTEKERRQGWTRAWRTLQTPQHCWRGRGGCVHLFCHTLESRTGNEISCLMAQLLKAQSNELLPQTQREREEKASKGNFMWLNHNLFLIFPPLFLG